MAKKDNLQRYREKRDFKKTPEPEGVLKKTRGNRYLIQKHEASHLHYDFRLELDGTLKSWAVPKGPSYDPTDRRLAMEVEDHPVSYGTFEGIIPKGQYGGGTVMLWDEGTWEPVGDAQEGLKKGKLVFNLYGERLQGEWTLVRAFGSKTKNGWLLIKHKDDYIRPGDKDKLLKENMTSVVSGRTMEEIASAGDKVWKSNRAQDGTKEDKTPASRANKLIGLKAGKAKKLPEFTLPQLATLSSAMPKGEHWVHEIKFDGYRMIAHIDQGEVQIFSRNGKDWTGAFQPIANLLAKLKIDNAIMDGEVIVVDEAGKSNFSELKDALSNGETGRFQYYVFDLLFLNGQDVRALPLLERKALLQELLEAAPKNVAKRVIYSEHFEAQTDRFLHNACNMQLEGIISKRADAPYSSGRSKIWLKTKCHKRQEFVIGGYTLPTKGMRGIGALLLGYYDGDELVYSGRVGTGFTNESSEKIRKMLERLRQKERPFSEVSTLGARKAIWVKPQLVCEVEFTEWTPDGNLRHPSFQGMREDKPAKDIVREVAISPKAVAAEIEEEIEESEEAAPVRKARARKAAAAIVKASTAKIRKPARKEVAMVAGITISHPDRVIYPDSHITKLQLAEYYHEVAEHILPHVVNRPLSMVRCPEGTAEPCFFQRHVGLGQSPHLYGIDVGVKGTEREYVMIKDLKGLISLAQWGVIELHPWQCTAKNLNKPDRIIFDLDPDPGVEWPQLIEGAKEVKARMEELGLRSFLKTTGGKGLHVVVPITPAYEFSAIKAFARAVAESMAADNPKRYIATMSKAARKGKIFVDYLRNDVTSTAVAAFSARARPGATVSMPIAWEQLTTKLKPSDFTVETAPAYLKRRKKDPWEDYDSTKQKIAAQYLKALKIAV